MLLTWKRATRQKETGVVVFLDLKRGFDFVNADIFLEKIEGYRSDGTVKKWFEIYLEERKQKVKISN